MIGKCCMVYFPMIQDMPSTAINSFGPATYAEIIFRAKETKDGNILSTVTIAEIQAIHSQIVEITLDDEGRGHSFTDLCAINNGSCVVDGLDILDGHMQTNAACLNDSTYHESKWKRNDPLTSNSQTLANVVTMNNCTFAKALRLRYNLKHDTTHDRQLSILLGTQISDQGVTAQSHSPPHRLLCF